MNLDLKNIYKSFGAVNVLEDVDFNIRDGEIYALLGENGAGKSTLMNIVGGIFSADSGEIFIDGKKRYFFSPLDSMKSGIAFIHQELNLVNDLTVYENLFLSDFIKKGLFLDKKTMIQKTSNLFESFGINIDSTELVGNLDTSYKQIVAITRALNANASLIIMDEPTTSLTPAETEHLFEIMRTLKGRGISIIFISHKLNEVMEICDKYSVLRNGKNVSTGNISDVTVNQLAEFMVGHEVDTEKKHSSTVYGDVVFSLNNFTDNKSFFDISLSVRKGEIVGFTGLLGDGRSEIFKAVFGINSAKYAGDITVDGNKIIPYSPDSAMKYGIAYLPNNRKENSIIADMTVLDNSTIATLKRYCNMGFLKKKKQKQIYESQKEALNIVSSDDDELIVYLSGGNQQKTVLARWLLTNPKVLILDNPTQGVDIAAKEEIYSIIENLAKKGIAIIVLSSESREIIRLCDRCIVMFHGKAVAEVSGEDMTEHNMIFHATGAGRNEEN